MASEEELGKAVCCITDFRDDAAVCDVDLVDKGFGFRNVGFSADLLKAKGLDIGNSFVWVMRDGSDIRPEDILEYVPPDPEEERRKINDEFQKEWEEYMAQRLEEHDWPETEGDGR